MRDDRGRELTSLSLPESPPLLPSKTCRVAQVQGAPFRMPPRRSSLANLGARATEKWGMRAAAADEDSRDLAEVSVVEFEGEGGR